MTRILQVAGPAFIAIYPLAFKGVLSCIPYAVVKAALRRRPAADPGAAPDGQAAL